MTPADRLRHALKSPAEPELEKPKPGSTWELFADHRLADMEEELRTIRSRIDGLIWTIIAAVVLAVLNYLTGAI